MVAPLVEVIACNVHGGHVPWEAVPIPDGVGWSASRQEQLRRAAGVAAPGGRRRAGEGAAVAGNMTRCAGWQEPWRPRGKSPHAWWQGHCCGWQEPSRRVAEQKMWQ